MALVAAFDAPNSRVTLVGTFVPNISGMNVYVERNAGGSGWVGVRSGSPVFVSSGGFTLYDYEFVPNVVNEYRLRTDFFYDDFNRNTTDSWGFSPSDHAWTLSGGTAANWDTQTSTDTGSYVMADAVNTASAQNSTATVQDFDWYGSIELSQTATGGILYAGMRGRASGPADTVLSFQFLTNASVDVALRGNNNTTILDTVNMAAVTPSVRLFFRFQAIGTALKAKVWQGTQDAEPNSWTLEGTDLVPAAPGTLQVEATRLTGNTNVNPVLFWRAMHAADLNTVNPQYSLLGGDTYITDTFTRTVSNGWGSADTGQAYTLSGAAANYSVSAANGGIIGNLTTTAQTALIPAVGADQDVYLDIRNPQAALTQAIQGAVVTRYTDANNLYRAVASFTAAGNIDLLIARSVAGVGTIIATANTAIATYAIGSFYRVRFQVKGTLLRAKIWLASAAEPDAWNLEIVDASLTAAGSVGVRAVLVTGNTNVTPELRFDNFNVGNISVGIYESVTPVQTGVWLKFPLRPFLNQEITFCNWGPETRPARGQVFDVLGRRLPIAVNEVRGSRRFDAIIKALDSDEAESIELALSFGDVILLQTPDAVTTCALSRRSYPAAGYFFVEDVESTRVVDGRPTESIEFGLIEVSGPDAAVEYSTVTWQGIINNFALWSDVISNFSTWLAVQQYISSPSDEIVG